MSASSVAFAGSGGSAFASVSDSFDESEADDELDELDELLAAAPGSSSIQLSAAIVAMTVANMTGVATMFPAMPWRMPS